MFCEGLVIVELSAGTLSLGAFVLVGKCFVGCGCIITSPETSLGSTMFIGRTSAVGSLVPGPLENGKGGSSDT